MGTSRDSTFEGQGVQGELEKEEAGTPLHGTSQRPRHCTLTTIQSKSRLQSRTPGRRVGSNATCEVSTTLVQSASAQAQCGLVPGSELSQSGWGPPQALLTRQGHDSSQHCVARRFHHTRCPRTKATCTSTSGRGGDPSPWARPHRHTRWHLRHPQWAWSHAPCSLLHQESDRILCPGREDA